MRRSPRRSDVDALGDAQGVLELDPQIAHSTVDLRVTQQELDRAQIAGLAVNLRRLGPPQRVRSISAGLEPNRRHPVVDEARVLPRRDTRPVMEAAREQERASEHLGPRDPGLDRGPCVLRDLELHGSIGLALDHGDTLAHAIADDQIGDL